MAAGRKKRKAILWTSALMQDRDEVRTSGPFGSVPLPFNHVLKCIFGREHFRGP